MQNVCQELLPNPKNQDDIVIVANAFDGSWGSWRWYSNTGWMGTIDVAILSNHFSKCKASKSKREIGDVDALQFMDWSIKHFPSCMMNHEGRAQVMYW